MRRQCGMTRAQKDEVADDHNILHTSKCFEVQDPDAQPFTCRGPAAVPAHVPCAPPFSVYLCCGFIEKLCILCPTCAFLTTTMQFASWSHRPVILIRCSCPARRRVRVRLVYWAHLRGLSGDAVPQTRCSIRATPLPLPPPPSCCCLTEVRKSLWCDKVLHAIITIPRLVVCPMHYSPRCRAPNW